MSEGADYDPGEYRGVDFKAARQAYKQTFDRSYSVAVEKNTELKDVRAESVESKGPSQLVVVADQTGSMGEWLEPIFAKLGYLSKEVPSYLGEEMEISFCAVGDALTGEKYPLQARPFAKGLALQDRLNELIKEAGGGGNGGENYELAALYYSRRCFTPNAVRKPIMVIVGDEQPHSPVSVSLAERITGVKLERSMTAKEIFEELKQKFSVYMVLKPYVVGADENNRTNKGIYNIWVDLLGSDNVKILPEADRVVDVIFGILAQETGKVEYFKDEISKRQEVDTPEGLKKVTTVFRALGLSSKKDTDKSGDDKKTLGGKSVLRIPKDKVKPGRLY